jgi:hypothetical protein
MFITTEIRVQSQASPCRIYDGNSDTGTGSFRVLWFRLVNIIPPVHHTHLFNYHRRCTYTLSNWQRNSVTLSRALNVVYHLLGVTN